MCGRFTLTSSGEALAAHFEMDVPLSGALEPRYNIAPTQPVLAVRIGTLAPREWARLRWGLVPFWAKDIAIGNRLINARSETVADKPAFRDALLQRRCLVVADGFFEWSGPKARRRPHWFRIRGGEPFAIAGLWARWEAPGGEVLESCTLLTTESNAAVRPHHHRMPVVLDPRDYTRWLDGAATPDDPLALLVPCPPDWVSVAPVGTAVNDARHDAPDCIAPPSNEQD